jgi:hypothetical protein
MAKRTLEEIKMVVAEMSDELFKELYDAWDKWVFGEEPKSKLNKLLKKANLTLEELEDWIDD